jgi:hypothetical protein
VRYRLKIISSLSHSYRIIVVRREIVFSYSLYPLESVVLAFKKYIIESVVLAKYTSIYFVIHSVSNDGCCGCRSQVRSEQRGIAVRCRR